MYHAFILSVIAKVDRYIVLPTTHIWIHLFLDDIGANSKLRLVLVRFRFHS
jgi:hypothetical protein